MNVNKAFPHGEIAILFACDAWKSRESVQFEAAAGSYEALCVRIAREVFGGNMDYDGKSGAAGFDAYRADYRRGKVDFGKLTYGCVEIIPLEQVGTFRHRESYEIYRALAALGDAESRAALSRLNIFN